MDGVQLGHYLDNVFAFRAGLDLKIGLGGMAAEASILHGLRQAWGLWKENVRGALTRPCLLVSPGHHLSIPVHLPRAESHLLQEAFLACPLGWPPFLILCDWLTVFPMRM